MAVNIGDVYRFGNPLEDPATGQPLAAPPGAFRTDGADADPTTVTLTVQRPDGTQLVYGWPSAGADGTLVREAAGRFYADIPLDQAGTWAYKLRGTGTVAAVEEATLRVERGKVT